LEQSVNAENALQRIKHYWRFGWVSARCHNLGVRLTRR